ncbi:TetR/AcrR family transcriptional regulator [Gordonia soli]|uniref:Putative TetR family transcriptional regulator n=1 Tax=Gordonia soli NBRC 108243 TaxID=1223545 RepID=M0QKW5_9ACTN|nr:TetR/AcrR family transcriptional regulator [Gordonia soli]GAC69203.1 putative TetR family transcriptional regulator [Gordonia soli NBRC 108243]
MGRPPKHGVDDFIDAAATIFAARGVRAVTLGAVADELGASNGSIYYRFPDRETLLRTLWSRSAERFYDDYRQVLGGNPTIADAIDSAAWIVDWCREKPARAQVLQAGSRTFDVEGAGTSSYDTEVIEREIRSVVATLADQTVATPDQIAFALIDLPLAAVRRHLQAGRALGRRESELVRGLASAILARPQAET